MNQDDLDKPIEWAPEDEIPEALPSGGDGEDFGTLFQPETSPRASDTAPWKILVVDDEGDVHAVVKLVLEGARIEGRTLQMLFAYSRAEALKILEQTPDIALVLLDVVMESEQAGLQLVEDIRERLNNSTVQIAIITGQPGQASEQQVIERYQINDYRLKTDLSAEKLLTLVYSGVRTYRAIKEQVESRERLERESHAREEAELRYQDLYDHAPDMYVSVSAEDASILQCNQTLVDTLGYDSKDDIIGRPVFDMYQQECMDQVRAAFQAFRTTGEIHDEELLLRRADGGTLHVSLNVTAVRDKQGRILHSRSAWRDITERKKAQAALLAAEERSRLLLESVGDGIIGVDLQGECTFVNPAALQLLGYRADELLGQRIHPVIHAKFPDGSDYPATQCPTYHSIRDGVSIQRDNEVLWRKDGSPVRVEYNSVPLRHDQKIKGSVIIFHDVTARHLAEQKIRHLAFHDPLTGLSNRALFTQHLKQALAGLGRSSQGIALHMLDLDHFKDVNDSLGHPIGDALLKAVAQRIKRVIRGNDTFARFGGDEFALLQTRVQSYSDASVTAAKILKELGREFVLEGNSIHTNASIGIVLPDEEKTTPEELIRKADVALYKAKESGRGTFAFFEDAMNRQLQREMKLSVEVMRALERDEFIVHYQPQFDLQNEQLIGLEALVRWQHPEFGLLTPADFLGVAEKRGLIQRISDRVFTQACRQSRIWSRRGLRFGRIAVNLSAQQLANQAFGENMLAMLRQVSADPRHLALELTETALINADVRTQADIIHLSELGIQFAIDDFGTGFSSLQYLRQFKADKLKIDREFIKDVEIDSDDAEIVKATIALGSALKMTTVAEGVETAGQAQFLRQHGCDQAQGFLYDRPDTVENVERKWLGGAEAENNTP